MAHQNFHVVSEAFKYFAASSACVAIAVTPLRRRERWAWWIMLVACLALFGGVFVAYALSRGGPAIDHWSYESFLAISLAALRCLPALLPAPTIRPRLLRCPSGRAEGEPCCRGSTRRFRADLSNGNPASFHAEDFDSSVAHAQQAQVVYGLAGLS